MVETFLRGKAVLATASLLAVASCTGNTHSAGHNNVEHTSSDVQSHERMADTKNVNRTAALVNRVYNISCRIGRDVTNAYMSGNARLEQFDDTEGVARISQRLGATGLVEATLDFDESISRKNFKGPEKLLVVDFPDATTRAKYEDGYRVLQKADKVDLDGLHWAADKYYLDITDHGNDDILAGDTNLSLEFTKVDRGDRDISAYGLHSNVLARNQAREAGAALDFVDSLTAHH